MIVWMIMADQQRRNDKVHPKDIARCLNTWPGISNDNKSEICTINK